LLAPRPTPKLEDHPSSAVRDCLFNLFAATLHIGWPLLHQQPEDAPCRGDGDPLITWPTNQLISRNNQPHTVVTRQSWSPGGADNFGQNITQYFALELLLQLLLLLLLLLLLYAVTYNIFPLRSFTLALSDGILYVTYTRAKLLLFTLWYLEFMTLFVVRRTLKMEAESTPKLRFTVTYRLPWMSLIALLVVKCAVPWRMFLLSDVSHLG